VSKVAAASTIAKTNATTLENRAKSLTIFFSLPTGPTVTLPGLELLLLLDDGLGRLRPQIMSLSQPHPDLRHMG
jgi:hypothetical protein